MTKKPFFERYKVWIALAVVLIGLEVVTRLWP
jgi:hypothetical protein